MDVLLILNDPPYGTERSYNGLRLPLAMLKGEVPDSVIVFLMADSVLCAKKGQRTPDGYYNIDRMLRRMLTASGRALLCRACMDARGLTDGDVIDGAARSNMDELASVTLAADEVIVF